MFRFKVIWDLLDILTKSTALLITSFILIVLNIGLGILAK